MKEEKAKNLSLLLVSTLLGAIGQLLFKYSLGLAGIPMAEWLALGLLSYVASTVLFLFVLSRAHLHWVYSIGGLSYVFAVIFAGTILGESIPPLRWAGVLVIFIGVAIMGAS
jgi:multidrug transporter EmrE-like cation transporter